MGRIIVILPICYPSFLLISSYLYRAATAFYQRSNTEDYDSSYEGGKNPIENTCAITKNQATNEPTHHTEQNLNDERE